MLEALRDRADFVSIDDLAHEIGVSNRKIGSMLGRMSERIALKAPKPLLKSVRTPVLLMIDTIYSKANKASYRLTEAGREAITMFLK
ncbi:hypothetical protein [Microvirga thermotolerans]|uniref:Uncharacterized protein n=1 Tax=Microvirga thermotolerans TaxID=2651334 RepID=A0A5P9JZ57_9HYPH|nr:hypothetical protein [Microvirga thermotolerans]QFU17887.1 hypothetical protein GDR74_17635 [Microvirga thermotolerans]